MHFFADLASAVDLRRGVSVGTVGTGFVGALGPADSLMQGDVNISVPLCFTVNDCGHTLEAFKAVPCCPCPPSAFLARVSATSL